MTLKKPR